MNTNGIALQHSQRGSEAYPMQVNLTVDGTWHNTESDREHGTESENFPRRTIVLKLFFRHSKALPPMPSHLPSVLSARKYPS